MGVCVRLGSHEEAILEEIYQVVLMLKTFNILEVPKIVVSKVACTIVAAKRMGIQVEWIDKVTEEITAKRDHFKML